MGKMGWVNGVKLGEKMREKGELSFKGGKKGTG